MLFAKRTCFTPTQRQENVDNFSRTKHEINRKYAGRAGRHESISDVETL